MLGLHTMAMWTKKEVFIFSFLTLSGAVLCQDQGAVAGLSTNIRCNFGRQFEAPFWVINDTVYDLFTIPRSLPFIQAVNSYSALQIPYVYLSLNNTVFQCAVFDDNQVLLGTLTRLIVLPNPSGEGNGDFGDAVASELVIDYQRLFVLENEAIVTWFVNQTCSTTFQVQGYNLLASGPVLSDDHVFNVSNANTFTIASDQYTSDGMDIDYRLVSLFDDEDNDDDDACPDNRDVYYYRFNDSKPLEYRVLNPNINSTVCYALPQTTLCSTSLRFVAGNHGCPVHNSTAGRMALQSCTRGYTSDMLKPELTENGEVCLYDVNSDSVANSSLYHFLCSIDPCNIEECLLRALITSHNLIFAGPPSKPNVFYNGSSLCFSAYSHDEFPVLYFTVEVSDVTGVPSNLTGTYNTRGPQCLHITSIPIPDLCLPFQASVSTANGIGTNSTTAEFSLPENEGVNICSCYLKREQLRIDVTNTTSESAILVFSCDRNNVTISYILNNQGTGQQRDFNIACGSNAGLSELSANTEYHILQRFGEIQCEIGNFTTKAETIMPTVHPDSNLAEIVGIVVGTVVAIAIIVAITVTITVMVIRMRRSRKTVIFKMTTTKSS